MSDNARTLVVFYPGCVEFEVMLAAELLNEHLPVEVTTPDGKDHEGSNGMVVRAAHGFADVEPGNYSVVLVPGGDVESVFDNDTLFCLLRRARDAGAIIAAICAGPILLSKAGLLTGRTFTHGMGDLYPERLAQLWAVGTYSDDLVVADDRIITAKPNGHIDFGVEVAKLAGIVPDDAADRLRAHYKGLASNAIALDIEPVGVVRSPRVAAVDDNWGNVESEILLDPARFDGEALAGLEAFSHLEVVYRFHKVGPETITTGSRHPRGRQDWPKVGIFAQRGKARPNRIGVSRCQLLGVEGLGLRVRGLDAIDGTPVLDIKPYMNEFGPIGDVRQPGWSSEIMAAYYGG